MTDNPPLAAAFASTGYRILCLEGRNAVAFAHAQFMNDVAALDAGRWQWNGWLTPKGRVIALFALLRRDDRALWLLLPDANPEALASGLRRFVFRSKVTLRTEDALQVGGAFVAPGHAAGGAFVVEDDGTLELDWRGEGGDRCLRIGVGGSADVASVAERWAAADLAHGLPRLRDTQAGHWTPQQLSLDRLRAYSVKKGCYPGQEIVARTHFLGEAKRGLVLLEADTPLQDGAEVHGMQGAIGRIVSSVDGAVPRALAVLRLDDPSSALTVEGIAVRRGALQGGLAR